jgi:hypothetical protein
MTAWACRVQARSPGNLAPCLILQARSDRTKDRVHYYVTSSRANQFYIQLWHALTTGLIESIACLFEYTYETYNLCLDVNSDDLSVTCSNVITHISCTKVTVLFCSLIVAKLRF